MAIKIINTTLTILLFACAFINPSAAATYYFSSVSGNDNRSSAEAQNPDTPWKSIQKLNEIFASLKPGDQVLFRRGEEFFGSIIVNRSGAAGNSIVIGAYGIGNNPIITGFTNASAWTNLGNNIWESTSAVSPLSSCNMVVINGINTPIGREPNSGYFPYQTFSTNTSITSSSVNSAVTNWTGAEAVIRKNHWIIDRYPITGHSGGTLTYSNGGDYNGVNNYGFFIQNDIRTLDDQNEWYYNPTTKKIAIYSTSEPTNVEVASVSNLVTIGASYTYITFDGLSFQGSNENTLLLSHSWGDKHITITNCNIDFSGGNAIFATASPYLIIENNTINHTNNNAIEVRWCSTHSSILNNVIKNTAIIPGMTKNGDNIGIGIFINSSDNSLVQYNKVESSGYIGIAFYGNSIHVLNNLVDNFCLIKDDGGGIYTYLLPNQVPRYDQQIIGNVVLNGIGTMDGVDDSFAWETTQAYGIYLDGNSANVDVLGNTVANISDHGIFIHGSKNIKIKDNTLYNNGTQLYFHNWGPGITGIDAKRNIYFSKDYSQLAWNFFTKANDIASFGVSDSNYYARPFDDKFQIHEINFTVDDYLGKPYNLAAWQEAYNQDLHSINSINLGSQYTYSALESNKYANEEFVSNVQGLEYSNCNPTWVNNGQLDDGYLQISNPTQSKIAHVHFNIGEVSSTKTYILKFSSKSIKNDSYLKINMIHNSSPWTQTKPEFTYIDTSRIETQLLITPTYDNSNVSVRITLDNADELVWIDNFQLYEVDTTLINKDKYLRFEYNASKAPKSIYLDYPMIDVKGTKYNGNVALQPFTSVVLIKDLDSPNNVTTPVDVTAPVITGFIIPPTSSSQTVFISTLSVSDSIKVTGYLLTETSSTPFPEASGWTSVKPTRYTFSSAGSKTLYAWAKDAAGNVSASVSDHVVITLPDETTPMVVPSVLRLNTGHLSDVEYNGETFDSDFKFKEYYGESSTYSNSNASDQELFQSERNGKLLKYAIPLLNGNYTLITYHNELYFGHSGPPARARRGYLTLA